MKLVKNYSALDIQQYLVSHLAQIMNLSPDEIDITQHLESYGLNSAQAMTLVGKVEELLGFQPSPVLLWHYPNIEALSERLAEECESSGSMVIDTNVTDKKSASPVKTATPVLDLSAELYLDPAIRPEIASKPTGQLNNVFLTGATGFLGAFLIKEILHQTDADIYCLVRGADSADAQRKLRNTLEQYGVWDEKLCERVIPILGDLSQPLLGISQEGFEMLAANMDAIYHSAAVLNYVYPYSAMKTPNVLGTQEVIRLASLIQLKPLHYISSVAIFESPFYAGKVVKEDDTFEHWQGIFLGYSQTKWVAENLVKIAGQRGLPVTIHRPPLIAADSQTGICNTEDFINYVIKGCIQMGYFPDIDYMLDASPVDYVSKAIVYLSQQPESIGQAFHLQHPEPVPFKNLVDWITNTGFQIQLIPYQEWQAELMKISDPSNPLFTLRPFLLERWSEETITIPDLYLQSRKPIISCEATLNALAGSGITCPTMDSRFFLTSSAFLINNGFLQPSG